LRGARVENVSRRGKHILVELDNTRVLIVHLRMTGKFLLHSTSAELPRHTHATFELDDGRRLLFNDQRQFGLMKIVRSESLYNTRELRQLAPEPFSDEFSHAYLQDVLSRSRRSLKELLIDQRKVTGLGNIYAAEALFLARANPFVPGRTFSARRIPRLHAAIRDVLSEAIEYGSKRMIDAEDFESSYFNGPYEDRWRVYDREGAPCFNCGARIRRITHGGRSTYFCPRCQRK
jgi:formamidopyrimidine-DNA glycosylase